MKYFTRLLAFSLFALSLAAQTKPNIADLRIPPGLIYLPNVGIVQLDGLVIDKSTNPPTLRAVSISAPGTAAGQDFDDVFVASGPQIAFAGIAPPKSLVRVYKNGVLQRAGVDYTLSVDLASRIATAVFLPAQPVTPGDFVTLSYQR